MIATHQYHCVSQPNIRIENRQAKNRKRECDPKRRAEVRKWNEGYLCECSPKCTRPANTPHHPHDGLYADEFWADLRECEHWNHVCHHKYHKGYVRCPKCGGWMRAGNEMCYKCNHNDNPATNPPRSRFKPAKRIKPKHPCQSHLQSGRCQKSRIYEQCTYAARNALRECEKARPRGAVPA